MALLHKSNEGTAFGLFHKVFCHFGAQVKMLADQDTKFQDEFDVLCDKTLIDHRNTS